jgi:hypothetical protein
MRDPEIRNLRKRSATLRPEPKLSENSDSENRGCEIKPARDLIYKYIEEGSLSATVGPSGAAKSLIVQDQGFCIAAGIPWHGKKVKPGPVLYICGEGLNGAKRRLLALAKIYGKDITTIPFYIAPGILLSDPDYMQTVARAVQAVFLDADTAPKLIIVDTWASALGADENSTADTVAGLSALTELAKPYGAAILIVHHTGHGDKGRARGSSALHAAMDSLYLVEKGDDEIVRLTNAKAKDFEPPAPMAFRIVPVGLDLIDEEGNQETSVVLESTDYEPEKAPREAAGKWQRLAMDTLRNLITQHQHNLEKKGFDPEGAKVSAQDWRHACLDVGIRRNRFYEIRKIFTESGVVVEEAGYVHPR